MNKYIWSILLSAFLCFSVKAQETSDLEIKVLSDDHKEPLIGATVYFEELKKGAAADDNGIVKFSNIPNGKHEIQISFIGFETLHKEIEVPSSNLVFTLKESKHELETVVIKSTRSSRTIRKTPTRVEFIAGEELGEKAMMNAANISMVLRESTGIQMQQTSLSSGSSSIKIQGLEGRYTQLLKDGFPLYGGFSSGLSIMQIPPLDLKQFEVIKGSSSTLYGGGAIAGLVNMISKVPEEDAELEIMLTQTQAIGSTANVFYSKRNDKFGTTLYGSGNYQKEYDTEDDHFSNLPRTRSVSFNPKIFYYPSEKTTVWLGLNGTYDERIGGDMDKIKGESGIHQYFEENISKRLSSQFVYNTKLNEFNSLQIKNSVAFFNRNLELPTFQFGGDQINTFTEINYNYNTTNTDWVFGGNLYTTKFKENNAPILKRNQEDVTFGFFVNNITDLSENWILESGLRLDYDLDFGSFPLPRVSLLYKEGNFSSRIGGGLGYKIPNIFTEEAESINFQNVLPINKDILKPEKSYGLNLDLNYKTKLFDELKFSVNQLFYMTSINDALLLKPNSGFYEYENASSNILSTGSETNIKFGYKDFKWFLNYALIDTRLNYLSGNPQKPLTAKHNLGSIIAYESEKWLIGYETYYTGQQYLPNRTKTNSYVTMGFLVMRNFDYFKAFVNFENFTDRRQSRFSPLVLPPHATPNFPEIYAPTDGFIFTAGIIIKPFGNKGHHH